MALFEDEDSPIFQSLREGHVPRPDIDYDFLNNLGLGEHPGIQPLAAPEPENFEAQMPGTIDYGFFETLGLEVPGEFFEAAQVDPGEPETYLEKLGYKFTEGVKGVPRQMATSISGLAKAAHNLKKKIPGYTDNDAIEFVVDFLSATNPITAVSLLEKAEARGIDAQDVFEMVARSKYLAANPDQGENNWFEDVVQMGPQIISAILAGAIGFAFGGPIGSMIGAGSVMGLQIMGGTIENLKQQGVPEDEAAWWGLTNAVMQAPLEAIPVGKAFKYGAKLFGEKVASKAMRPLQAKVLGLVKDIGKNAGTEFITEWAQSYPESFVQIFATNPDKTLLERSEMFAEQLWETTKQGMYEGSVAAPWSILTVGAGHAYGKAKQKFGRKTSDQFGDPPIIEDEDMDIPVEDVEREAEETPGAFFQRVRQQIADGKVVVTEAGMEQLVESGKFNEEQAEALRFDMEFANRRRKMREFLEGKERMYREAMDKSADRNQKLVYLRKLQEIKDRLETYRDESEFDREFARRKREYPEFLEEQRAKRDEAQFNAEEAMWELDFESEWQRRKENYKAFQQNQWALQQQALEASARHQSEDKKMRQALDRASDLRKDFQDVIFANFTDDQLLSGQKIILTPEQYEQHKQVYDALGDMVFVDRSKVPPDLRGATNMMREQVMAGDAKNYDENGVPQGSSYPRWFRQAFPVYKEKEGPRGQGKQLVAEDYVFSRKDFLTVLDKIENGKELTPRQAELGDRILHVARELNNTIPELARDLDIMELEKAGYEIVGQPMRAGDFELADQITVQRSDGALELLTVIAEDDGQGNIVYGNSFRYSFNPDEMVDVVAYRRNEYWMRMHDKVGNKIFTMPRILPGVKLEGPHESMIDERGEVYEEGRPEKKKQLEIPRTEYAKPYQPKKPEARKPKKAEKPEPKKPEAAAPEPKKAEPKALTGKKVVDAYKAVKDRIGYSNVPIADLRDELGISQDEMARIITETGRQGEAVMAVGDWSLSDKHIRSGVIESGGYRYLLVKFLPKAEAAIDKIVEPEKPIVDRKELPEVLPDDDEAIKAWHESYKQALVDLHESAINDRRANKRASAWSEEFRDVVYRANKMDRDNFVSFAKRRYREGDPAIRQVSQRYGKPLDNDTPLDEAFKILHARIKSGIQPMKRLDEMTANEVKETVVTDFLTGLKNSRAFYLEDADTRMPFVSSLDLDALKWLNDNLGHDVGDEMLRTFADAMRASGIPEAQLYRVGGDEFYMQGNTREELEAATEKINDYLKKNPIVGRFMGKTINYNLGVSYGIEETIQKAEEALSRHKAVREDSGVRPRRGETPGTIIRELAERHGIDVPIRTKDQGPVKKAKEPTRYEEIAMSIPEKPKQTYTEDDLRFLPPALEVEITAIDPETQKETKERVSAERAYNEQVSMIDRLYDFLECLKTAV